MHVTKRWDWLGPARSSTDVTLLGSWRSHLQRAVVGMGMAVTIIAVPCVLSGCEDSCPPPRVRYGSQCLSPCPAGWCDSTGDVVVVADASDGAIDAPRDDSPDSASGAASGDGFADGDPSSGDGSADGSRRDGAGPACTSPRCVEAISTGFVHSCAITRDTSVLCWGNNSAGQLGTMPSDPVARPVVVPGVSSAIYLAVGDAFSCVVDATHRVLCWGAGSDGQLGDGNRMTGRGVTLVVGITNAIEVAAGSVHACALLEDGRVQCWGANGADGLLGDGSGVARRPTPGAVPGLTGVAQLAAGRAHTCARLREGTVTCWGNGETGQLGDGSLTTRPTPTPVSGLRDVAEIAAGAAHTCARLTSGSVYCWGANGASQLGNGTTMNRAEPFLVPGVRAARGLRSNASSVHTCVAQSEAGPMCWGANVTGQLGDGTASARSMAAVVGEFASLAEVTTGGEHSCGRLIDGMVRCWGGNRYGQVGDGTIGGIRLMSVPVMF